MFRVLLAYNDSNTKSLLKKKFEQDGFSVVEYIDCVWLEPNLDLIIADDGIALSDNIDIPILRITKETLNMTDSAKIAYINKPFRPTELVLKARLLLEISYKNVRKTA